MEINASTRYCAVLGHPIRHSASPAMQNAGFAALGLNWRYLAFDVRADQLRAGLEGAKALRFVGLNLTVPHKLLALEMVDELDESARSWGAVNTIRFEALDPGGTWRPLAQFTDEAPEPIRAKGFNTDADAVVRALRDNLGLKSMRDRVVLLLGAGGAGRVTALRLAFEKVGSLFLVNRTVKKAEDLAAEIRARFPHSNVIVGYPKGKVDLVVNATSLGLQAYDGLPFDETHFSLRQSQAVYDMIYRPAETPLLKAGRAAGCHVANGLDMLLHQGAGALEIWCGITAPLEPMRRALEKEVYGP